MKFLPKGEEQKHFINKLKRKKKKPTEACKRLTVSLISIFTLKSFQRKAPFLQLTLPGTELSGF